jgi:hypothetical protein
LGPNRAIQQEDDGNEEKELFHNYYLPDRLNYLLRITFCMIDG